MSLRHILKLLGNALIVFSLVGAFILGLNHLDRQESRQLQEIEKSLLADRTIVLEQYRLLQPVPGFIEYSVDSYSECLSLGHALAPQGSMFGVRPWNPQKKLSCEGLQDSLVYGAPGTVEYSRYWQGSAAILKLVLNSMTLSTLRWLLLILISALLSLFVYHLWRRSVVLGIGAIVTLFGLSDFIWLPWSIPHGVAAAIGLMGVALTGLAFRRDYWWKWSCPVASAFLYGAIGYLTTPAAFAALTGLAIAFELQERTSRCRRKYVEVSMAMALWLVGFVLAYLSRFVWVIYFGSGTEQLTQELSGGSAEFTTGGIEWAFDFSSLLLRTWMGFGWMQISLCLYFALLGWIWARSLGQDRRLNFHAGLLFAIPASVPVAWLFMMGPHNHNSFAISNLAIIVLSVLCASVAAGSVPANGQQGALHQLDMKE